MTVIGHSMVNSSLIVQMSSSSMPAAVREIGVSPDGKFNFSLFAQETWDNRNWSIRLTLGVSDKRVVHDLTFACAYFVMLFRVFDSFCSRRLPSEKLF